jgi:hypothetical protein
VGQRHVDELLEAIEREEAIWVRIAATIPDGEAELALRLFDAVAGAPPPKWRTTLWSYPRALFYAEMVSGPTVTTWLGTKSIDIDGRTIPLEMPAPSSKSTWDHYASGSRRSHGPLQWPSNEWTIRVSGVHNPTTDIMIGDGSTPSFMDLNTALSALLGIETPTNNSIDDPLTFRQQILTARIAGVHIYPTKVEVDIDGDALVGTSVELAGSQIGSIENIDHGGKQTASLPTSSELATGSWVVVRRDNQWLDRRFLDAAYSRLQADDVDEWTEPIARLERLVSAGEGPNSEFKEIEPADKLKLMKTVAAFSNGSGGSILIGVRDDGEVVGVPAEVANAGGRDRLANLIRSWTIPLPDFEIDTIGAGGGLQVIIITVSKGPLPPYGAGKSAETLQYFVRRGATTFAAAPDQLRDMARSTPPVSSSGNTLTY